MKTIILALTVLLLISGCSGGFLGKSSNDAASVTTEKIYKGKEGLTWKFFENAPPDEVYENGILPVGIRLFNKGASDIKNGYLLVWTDNNQILKLDQDSLIPKGLSFTDDGMIKFDLNGKNAEFQEGGSEILTFNFKTEKLSVISPTAKELPVKVKVTYCHKYQTIVGETVCIDAGSEQKVRDKSCKVENLNLDSQGAPVAVTKIESEMIPIGGSSSKVIPRFTILVQNLDQGIVVKDDVDIKDSCSKTVIRDKIKVVARLSNEDGKNMLKCSNGGIVTLEENKGTIVCSYEEGFDENMGTFSAPLYITLDYGYTKTGWKEVKIKKLGK